MGKHAIIVVKNDKNEYLQKYIESWSSYLFLNCKVSDYTDIDTIKKYVSEELGVEDIEVNYVDERTHSKFSEKDKIVKEYIHYFFSVVINDEYTLPENCKWFSMEDLENDERIMEVNSDIVGYIRELHM